MLNLHRVGEPGSEGYQCDMATEVLRTWKPMLRAVRYYRWMQMALMAAFGRQRSIGWSQRRAFGRWGNSVPDAGSEDIQAVSLIAKVALELRCLKVIRGRRPHQGSTKE